MVETELRLDGAQALFVVRTDEPDFREVLPGLAYAAEGDEFVRRFPRDAPDLEGIHGRFAAALPELLAQTARRTRPPWERAVAELAERLEGVDWFLCGSAALAVRGIAVEPRDVDFVPADHAAAARALADVLIEPPLRDRERRWVAEWFGRAWLGARVEWAAGAYRLGSPSEIDASAAARLERVGFRGRTLLVTPLDVQLAVNESRGLADRVEAIRRFRSARAGGSG